MPYQGSRDGLVFILHTEEHPYLPLHSLYTVNYIYAFKIQSKGRKKAKVPHKSVVVKQKVPHKNVVIKQKVPHKSVAIKQKVPHKNVKCLRISLIFSTFATNTYYIWKDSSCRTLSPGKKERTESPLSYLVQDKWERPISLKNSGDGSLRM